MKWASFILSLLIWMRWPWVRLRSLRDMLLSSFFYARKQGYWSLQMASLWTRHDHWMLGGLQSTTGEQPQLQRQQRQRSIKKDPTGPSRTHSQYVPEGVPLINEDSQGHRDRIFMFHFMQDLYVYTWLLGQYLTQQVDTWGASQHLRDRFSSEPPAPFYGGYQYPGMDTPIQLRGPVQQQHHHQSHFSQPTP